MDLVNTISWRGAPERQEDHLLTAGDALQLVCSGRRTQRAESTALAARRGFGDVLLTDPVGAAGRDRPPCGRRAQTRT